MNAGRFLFYVAAAVMVTAESVLCIPVIAEASDTYNLTGEEASSGELLIASMQEAVAKNNYELLFTHLSTGQAEPVILSHGVDEKGNEISHWLYLDGEPSGYFTKGKTVVYFTENKPPLILKNSRLPSAFSRITEVNLKHIFKYYDVAIVGVQRIAGRSADVVSLKAKKNDRFGYLLYIDHATGILLQLEVLGTNDSMIESFSAVNLKVLKNLNSTIKNVSNADIDNISGSESFNNVINNFNWTINGVPEGYERIYAQNYVLADGTEVDHVIYDDGLSDFSVYRINAVGSMGFPIVKQGELNLYRHQVDKNYEIAVIGNIPLDLEKNIAESYKIVNGNIDK